MYKSRLKKQAMCIKSLTEVFPLYAKVCLRKNYLFSAIDINLANVIYLKKKKQQQQERSEC